MSEKISLKQAERSVFKIAFSDGLWDVLIGCIALQFSIAPLLSRSMGDFWSSAVFLPLYALVFVLILLVRKHIVKPRIGLVAFGPSRKKRLTRFTLLMLAVNVIALMLGTYFALKPGVSSGRTPLLFFGLIVLSLSSIAAYYLNFVRYFIYGLLFVVSFIIGEWLYTRFGVPHHGYPVMFGITAGIIILVWLIRFYRFLRDNPLPAEETS